MIIGTIVFFDHMDFLFFDLGSNFSFMLIKFAIDREVDYKYHDASMYGSTRLGCLFVLIRYIVHVFYCS